VNDEEEAKGGKQKVSLVFLFLSRVPTMKEENAFSFATEKLNQPVLSSRTTIERCV